MENRSEPAERGVERVAPGAAKRSRGLVGGSTGEPDFTKGTGDGGNGAASSLL
jgi:hypothetical protein